MCEEEAAAEKLQTDHKHPFPIHTALFGREGGGPVGKEGVMVNLEKRVGWRIVLMQFVCFAFPKTVLFGNK